MSSLVLHPITAGQLAAFKQSPSHALLLVGPPGAGKFSIADQLAKGLLAYEGKTLQEHPYLAIIQPDEKNTISIEAVRQLEQFLKLKVPNRDEVNRLVIIEDSHNLGVEAQNALLKTLEEPPAGTVLVLTAAHPQSLLPTILSRTQQIAVKRPAEADLQEYFNEQGYSESEIKQALTMSGGLPGLTQALLAGEEHPLRLAVVKARELLSQTQYERLLLVDELSKQRSLCIDIMFILQQMAHISLQSTNGTAAKRWQTILEASYNASESLQNSAQPKLVLDNFILHI